MAGSLFRNQKSSVELLPPPDDQWTGPAAGAVWLVPGCLQCPPLVPLLPEYSERHLPRELGRIRSQVRASLTRDSAAVSPAVGIVFIPHRKTPPDHPHL